MFNFNNQNQISDNVVFIYGNDQPDQQNPQKIKADEPNLQRLFLLSNFCKNSFFGSIPKLFTISAKNCVCKFNIEMLKNTSPVISKYIQDHPDEMNYHLNFNDEEKVLIKFEKLYQGEKVFFSEDEIPTTQRITKSLQIKKCPYYLKPNSLCDADELYSFFNSRNRFNRLNFNNNNNNNNNIENEMLKKGVELDQPSFVNFLKKNKFQTFGITTKHNQYQCNIFGIYTSDVLRQIVENDSTKREYNYDFDDENNEFQLICDFFNFNIVNIKSDNMDFLKQMAVDLKINCIINQIDNYINSYEKVIQKIDEQQKILDSIDFLFDLLCNIKKHGIEKVKISIIQSKWSKNEENIQELIAFILQVIKPDFTLHEEIIELIIQLDKEANETNKLNLLKPLLIEKLMTFYMPKKSPSPYKKKIIPRNLILRNNINTNQPIKISFFNESINLTNKYVYLFIRLLYKKKLISKEEIIENLKDYDCMNKCLNIYFLPEIVKINPKNINTLFNRGNTSKLRHNKVTPPLLLNLFKKYLPDKTDLYEKMLDNVEPDDELTKSLRHDDVDLLQRIIITNRIDIPNANVPYNIFDDIEEEITLLNYAALYGSIRCFKYLFLNKAEIDETTFYFAVFGGNNEIIKIIDQNKNNVVMAKNMDNVRFNICYGSSFWFKCNASSRPNTNFSNNKDRFNDENIHYLRNINNNNSIFFLNCCNVNNIIAPTIAMHRNELFDWIFENKFIFNGKSGSALEKIANLSAFSGNSHSLIEIIDNGIDLSSNSAREIIFKSAKNGFYELTKLLLNLMDQKVTKESITKKEKENDDDSIEDAFIISTVYFGNLSIFKLFIKQMNQSEIENAILYAIYMNHSNIIRYFFENLSTLGISKFDEEFITTSLTLSFSRKNDDLFNFLREKFNLLNPEFFKFESIVELLNKACLNSNLPSTKTITDLILKEDPKYDFSNAFIEASSSNSMSICEYFINEKKVFINYEKLSSQVLRLGSIDIKFFELIIHNVNPCIKYKFYKCINQAIQARNKNLIDFLLKENKPVEFELLEAVLTHDIEIVELVLKYNNKPSFINQKSYKGTAICIAASDGNLDIVKLLLSIPGIDPSVTVHNLNPLLSAINSFDNEIIDSIVNFYLDKENQPKGFFENAIAFIQYNYFQAGITHDKNEWDIVKNLFRIKSIDPNICFINENVECDSFLYMACYDNEIDAVEYFLSLENIDVNKCDSNSLYSPLMISIEKGNIEIVKLLLKNPKIDINWRNIDDESALSTAVKKELIEIIDLIINDKRFDPFETKLNISFIFSNLEISKKLCSIESLDVNQSFNSKWLYFNGNGFRRKEVNYKDINALNHSVETNNVDKIDLIINHPSFDKYKSDINKAIFTSVKNNNIDVFKKLIGLIDDDINIINENGESLLVFAAMNLSGEIVDYIFNNPKFDSKSDQICNALIQSISLKKEQENNVQNNALRNQHIPMWQFQQIVLNQGLIPDKISMIEILNKVLNFDKEHEHLIDINKLLPNGKSFFTIINPDSNNMNDIFNFLIENDFDFNMQDNKGVCPLEYAIKISSIDLVKSLVNSDKIVYNKLKNGSTFLHIAAENTNSEILSFLLDKNLIDINSTNECGETPLMMACKIKSIENIILLFKNDDLDYLHCDKNGKDALGLLDSLQQDEIGNAKQSKESYKNKLISIISEKYLNK